MFTVYDTGKLAKFPECRVSQSWACCTFKRWEDARDYVYDWLGDTYAPRDYRPNIEVGVKYFYNENSYMLVEDSRDEFYASYAW